MLNLQLIHHINENIPSVCIQAFGSYDGAEKLKGCSSLNTVALDTCARPLLCIILPCVPWCFLPAVGTINN